MDWLQRTIDLQAELTLKYSGCQECPIGVYAHKKVHLKVVPGSSEYILCDRAPLLLIGEAPGTAEDVIGLPFVGRSGTLLNTALSLVKQEASLDVPIVICNVVACRPCEGVNTPNRPPDPVEILNCSRRFKRILDEVDPSVVVPMGRVANKAVYKHYDFKELHKVQIVPTVHPAFVARQSLQLESKLGKDFLSALARAYDLAEEYVDTCLK